MRVVVLQFIHILSLKFVGLAIRNLDMAHDGPNLRLFDFETGMRVASKVGNLPSKFGHARRRYMFCPCLFVCLTVCLLARLLKNAWMDLNEMLRVDKCRDMDEHELINFCARSGS